MHVFAFENLIWRVVIALVTDAHFAASRMMIGGILLSAGGLFCATCLAGAGRLGLA
jgi:hypothetical protein